MRAPLAWLLLPALGCVTASPVRTRPRGPDTTRTLAEVPVRGAPVVVTSEAGPLRIEGELLAVDAQHVWVEHEAAPCPVERTGFLVVRVQTGDGAPGKAGAWTALGTLSTLSHGILLVVWAAAIDNHKQDESYWALFCEKIEPARTWMAEAKPDVCIVVYNDHASAFSLKRLHSHLCPRCRRRLSLRPTRAMGREASPQQRATPTLLGTWPSH